MGRTDPYVVVVSNHSTGERFQAVGSKKECEQAAADKLKEWEGDETAAELQKRK